MGFRRGLVFAACWFHTLQAKEGGLPDEVLANQELQQLVLPIFRADSHLCFVSPERKATLREELAHNAPSVCLAPQTALFVYGGKEEARTTAQTLGEWKGFISEGKSAEKGSGPKFEVKLFQGAHFFLQTDFDNLASALAGDVLSAISQG